MAESETESRSKVESRESGEQPTRAKPRVASVVIYRDRKGEWRWKALAANHKTVSESGEGYRNRPWARKMALEMFPDAKVVWGDK